MAEHSNYLLIGAGLTSAMAAKAIRQCDDSGSITILGAEEYLPYDRPPLSKDNLHKAMSPDDIASVDEKFYSSQRVMVKTESVVERIDRDAKSVSLINGDQYGYDKLLIATGSKPKVLEAEGDGVGDVSYLRTYGDSVKLRKAMEHARAAVLVGAGYISIEVAAACAQRGVHATIIEPKHQIWSKFASKACSEFLYRHFERLGVKFFFGDSVARVDREGAGLRVHTKTGQGLPANFVLAGIGVTYNSGIAKDAGLEVDEKGRIRVDKTLRTTEDPSIWAAGDLAAYHDDLLHTEFNAEHYMNAKWMGERVGKNMAGAEEDYAKIPYFFSDMGPLHMVLRGHTTIVTETRILGNRNAEEFVELYRNKGDALAMAIAFSHNSDKLDRLQDRFEELILKKVMVDHVNAEDLEL